MTDNKKSGSEAAVRFPIARELTVRTAAILLVTFAVIFVGAYHTVSDIVKTEVGHYNKALVSIFGDLIVREGEDDGTALTHERCFQIGEVGDYFCRWYRVNYVYVYVPVEGGSDTEYIAVSGKEGVYDGFYDLYMTHVRSGVPLSDDERKVWDGELTFAVSEHGRFMDTKETVLKVTDGKGNSALVAAAVSTDEIKAEIREKFITLALLILTVFAVLIITMYLMITRRVSVPARKISKSMTEFIRGGVRSETHLDIGGGDEFAMIASAFNKMTDEIDEYITSINTLSSEKERQQTELDIASKIQKGFLPPPLYSDADIDITAMMTPAKDVGGDLYDYAKLDENRTLVVIADISGKGIAAAMLMAVTLTLIRQYADTGESPAKILKNVNDMLSERNPNMLFATAFVGIYDRRDRSFTYSNAGHNLPYIVGTEAAELTGAENTLLGLFPGEEYTEAKIYLSVGDVLYLYTDGVNEAVSADGAFFGNERIEDALISARTTHDGDVVKLVYRAVADFACGIEPHDDITMLALTVKETKSLSLDCDVAEFGKIKEAILSSGLSRPLMLDLCVAAEEIFVNICSYAFEGRQTGGEKIAFTLECSDRVTMRFEDGGMKYDPTESVITADEYDLDSSVGGLGKLIAFSVADDVTYEYKDGKNILTIFRYIKERQNEDN